MGDSINMAARLMCLNSAKQSILCDERTYTLCRAEFDFEILGTVQVKGKQKPISIYRPILSRTDKARQELKSVHGQAAMEANLPYSAKGGVLDGPEFGKRSQLIGRKYEKVKIVAALDKFASKNDQLVVAMEAEAGMGLSSLTSFLMDEARDKGFYIW
jgi:hypothetical protein